MDRLAVGYGAHRIAQAPDEVIVRHGAESRSPGLTGPERRLWLYRYRRTACACWKSYMGARHAGGILLSDGRD